MENKLAEERTYIKWLLEGFVTNAERSLDDSPEQLRFVLSVILQRSKSALEMMTKNEEAQS